MKKLLKELKILITSLRVLAGAGLDYIGFFVKEKFDSLINKIKDKFIK